MKRHFLRLTTTTLLAACIASGVSCYYPAYPRGDNYSAYNRDSKGYDVPQEPMPPQGGPHYAGVDPGLAIAGVAAAGLLGYAIGNHHGGHDHYHYGPRYYRPAPYGYGHYGPRYYH